ncbi:MAG: dihydroorotate dehydrogenase electron transfer subunit [Dehalococcoidales bacterium]|nr:dihydroorotate dehydrogenase electron transfer subunit [Dehalococcoidales bacterium]
MKQNLASVISNVELAPGVHLLWLESPEIAAAAKPGQFVMVDCGEDMLLRRPLSIHQVDHVRSKLALLFATVGKGTHWLSQRKAGEKVDILGPLGNGFTILPNTKHLLLIAGGIGIAPLSFLAETAANQGCAVKLVQGANDDVDVLLDPLHTHYTLVPRGMVATATQYAGAGTIDCFAGTASVSSRWPTQMATAFIPSLADWADQVFACGPMPMYKAMAKMPELKGKSVQVSLEIVMGCGRGICYGCTIKTKKGLKEVCKDGPVFDMDDIPWDELK